MSCSCHQKPKGPNAKRPPTLGDVAFLLTLGAAVIVGYFWTVLSGTH